MKFAKLMSVTLLIALWATTPAFAEVELVESCTDTVEAAVITWDCEFQDTTYAIGDVATLVINWSSTQAASFSDVTLRGNRFTPRAKFKVDGTDPVVESVVDGATGSVTVSLMMVDLHQAGKKGKKGNAHLSLMLFIDEDGDGTLEEKPVKFGVNLHVTEPNMDPELSRSLRLASDEAVESVSWGNIKSRFGN